MEQYESAFLALISAVESTKVQLDELRPEFRRGKWLAGIGCAVSASLALLTALSSRVPVFMALFLVLVSSAYLFVFLGSRGRERDCLRISTGVAPLIVEGRKPGLTLEDMASITSRIKDVMGSAEKV